MSAEGNAAVEVVTASQEAEVHHDVGYWEAEWVATGLGIAITTEVLRPARFETLGRAHVWSLRTAKVIRTIEVPARIQAIVGDRESPSVIVAGGPYGKYTGTPFVWRVNVISGDVMDRFLVWPEATHGTHRYFPSIIEGALSHDHTRFFLKLKEGYVAYELSQPQKAPIPLTEAEWETLAEPLSVPPNALPNWFLKIGASDKYLTLNETSEGVGLWRNDTWELVLQLRLRPSPIVLWIPAPNGTVVLGVRAYGEAHLIWDLKNLHTVDWLEPNLLLWCEPAFTDDGSVLRFARETSGRRVEFVSRDWRRGEENIEYSTQVPTGAYFRGSRANEGITAYFNFSQHDLSAEFSDDARALIIGSELGSAAIGFASSSEPPSVSNIGLCAGHVAGTTADRRFIYYWPPIDREKIEYNSGWEWDVEKARAAKIVEFSGGMHPPALVFNEHPRIEGQVLVCRVSGASMGPYGFHLWTRSRRGGAWQPWPEDELQSLAGGALVHSANGRRFLLAWFDHAARSFDPDTGKKLATFERNDLWPVRGMQRRAAAPLAGRLFLSMKNGGAQVLEVTNEGVFREMIQLWSPAVGSRLAVLPDGRYFASPVANLPIFFRRGDHLYPVEDYDLHWNRPADIARAFGAPDETVQIFETRQQKRIQHLGNKHLVPEAAGGPSLTIECAPSCIHDSATLRIPIRLAAGEHPISGIDLYVNDVPVYGHRGYSIHIPARTSRTVEIVTPLTTGTNKIQIAARDASSAVSGRSLLNVQRSRVGSRPTRFIVSIGVSDYGNPDVDLAYAAKDANDIAAAMASAAAKSRDTRTLVLTDAFASRKNILKAKKFLCESRTEDEVIVFVAGHGVMADDGEYFFCPSDFERDGFKQGLSFTDLESLFDGIPALNRLLLVDSCHSGELTEEEADSIAVKYEASLSENNVRIRRIEGPANRAQQESSYSIANAASDLFLDLRRTTGATVISASGALEFAYEDSTRQNGLFTHSILEVIDDTVDSHEGTLRASTLADRVGSMVETMTNGLQNPRARFVNLATDFPIVASDEFGPPGDPQSVVIHYLKWSSLANQSLHPRQMTCFAPEVSYYGKLLGLDEVRHEEQAYGERFRVRNNKIKKINVGPPEDKETFRVEVELEFDHLIDMEVSEADEILKRIARGEKTGWRDASGSRTDKDGNVTHRMLKRVGIKTVAAFVRKSGHEWKIVGIELVDRKQ